MSAVGRIDTVTVVIVNWNGGDLLLTCIKHLLIQTHVADKIIVIDNGSTDGSAELADKIPGITVNFTGVNHGFAKANNLAISQCDTEYVALLNPDAFAEPDWLERLLNAAKAYQNVASFGSRQLDFETDNLLDGIGDVYHASGLVWRDGHGRCQSEDDLNPRVIFSSCAAAALYRRDVIESLGGFDEDYFCYIEDVDLGFRLRLAGYSSMYVPDAVVRHVGSATTGGQDSDFSIYHGHRNLVWTFVKDMPGILFWILLPMHVLLNVISLAWFSYKGRGRVIFRAKWDAICGLSKAWKKRRAIQCNRIARIADIWRLLDKQILPFSRK